MTARQTIRSTTHAATRMDAEGQSEPEIEPPAFVVESDELSRAFSAARRAHAGHMKGGRPYLEHPIQVAGLLRGGGYAEATIAAGLLHDVVEDSEVTVGEVVASFGPEVGKLVAALTEDPAIEDWEARKQALRERAAGAGSESIAIYTADKLANLSNWRSMYAKVGERAVEFFKAPTLAARIRAWRADLEMGKRCAPGSGLNVRLRRELEKFVGDRRPESDLR